LKASRQGSELSENTVIVSEELFSKIASITGERASPGSSHFCFCRTSTQGSSQQISLLPEREYSWPRSFLMPSCIYLLLSLRAYFTGPPSYCWHPKDMPRTVVLLSQVLFKGQCEPPQRRSMTCRLGCPHSRICSLFRAMLPTSFGESITSCYVEYYRNLFDR
jgi:hypothetical protein